MLFQIILKVFMELLSIDPTHQLHSYIKIGLIM